MAKIKITSPSIVEDSGHSYPAWALEMLVGLIFSAEQVYIDGIGDCFAIDGSDIIVALKRADCETASRFWPSILENHHSEFLFICKDGCIVLHEKQQDSDALAVQFS